MKIAGLAVMMLMVGYLLGGWGPKGELFDLQEKLNDAREELAEKGRSSRSVFGGVTQILDIPDDMPAAPAKPVKQSAPPADGAPVELDVQPAEDAEAPQDLPAEPTGAESFKDQLDVAVDAWAVRSEIARNSFVEQVDMDEGQVIRFDVLVEAMNLRIENTIARFVDEVRVDEKIAGEELGLRLVKEVSDAMVLTYDELDRNMPADWRKQAGGRFSLSDLIDPRVAMPLVDLEDRLDME